MRIERAKAKTVKMRSRAGLAGAMAVLALAAGTLLAAGGTSTKTAASSVGGARAETASTALPGTISPREAIADRDCLDLQLD